MKVLIVSPSMLPVPAVKGGAVEALIESLIKQNEQYKKIELTVVCSWTPDAEKKSKEYPNTEFIYIKNFESFEKTDDLIDCAKKAITKKYKKNHYVWKMHVIRCIKKILMENEYDRIVFQNSGYLLKSVRNKKLLSRYKGRIYYHLHNDIPANADLKVLAETKFILIREYLQKGVIHLCGENSEKRCQIVKNGIDIHAFDGELTETGREAIRCQLGVGKSQQMLIFVGRIKKQKGLNEVLTALEKLDSEKYVLVVVGSTNFAARDLSDYEKNVKRRCRHLGKRVVFTGYISYGELWKYYKAADIAVLPSIWEEPAGLTMLEAAVCGLPVITTVSGGIPEYLKSDQAIFLKRDQRLADEIVRAVERITSDEEKYKELAERASMYVKQEFSEVHFYNQFVSALQEKVVNE